MNLESSPSGEITNCQIEAGKPTARVESNYQLRDEQNGTEVHNMLLESWNMDEALAVSKEEGFEDGYELGEKHGEQRGIAYGEKKKQEDLIRKFSKINTPEQIAEILQTSKEYVLDVLKQDMCVCEPEHPYNAKK